MQGQGISIYDQLRGVAKSALVKELEAVVAEVKPGSDDYQLLMRTIPEWFVLEGRKIIGETKTAGGDDLEEAIEEIQVAISGEKLLGLKLARKAALSFTDDVLAGMGGILALLAKGAAMAIAAAIPAL